jgi:hypothetical protein
MQVETKLSRKELAMALIVNTVEPFSVHQHRYVLGQASIIQQTSNQP